MRSGQMIRAGNVSGRSTGLSDPYTWRSGPLRHISTRNLEAHNERYSFAVATYRVLKRLDRTTLKTSLNKSRVEGGGRL